MATQNPLNKFVVYTYHFAFFVARSVEKIEAITKFPDGVKTLRYDGVDYQGATLLVNSVMDAHQHIDDVSFVYVNSFVNTGTPLVACGELSMNVIEPGDCMFLHKLKKAMDLHGASNLENVAYGLLIKFVGRTADGKISEHTVPIISMHLANMRANFDHKGGAYAMQFVMASTFGATHTAAKGHSLAMSTVGPQAVSFSAKMLGQAIDRFKDAMQQQYDSKLKNENDPGSMRRIKYEFEYPSEFNGYTVRNNAPKDSSADTEYIFNIPAGMQICDALRLLVSSSDEANKEIAQKSGFKKQKHKDAKVWTYVPIQQMKDAEVSMKYMIKKYEGAKIIKEMIYDFYFAEDPNVDVLSYDVSFPQSSIAYLGGATDASASASARFSSEPTSNSTDWKDNVFSTNIPKPFQTINSMIESTIGKSGDVMVPQSAPAIQGRGFISTQVQDVPSKKDALMTMAQAMAADFGQKTLKIRGNPDLLQTCIGPTSGSPLPFGIEGGIWVKVNVFTREMVDGKPGERIPYFYQGWYHLISVQSHFSGGKFEQDLTLVMLLDDEVTGEL